MVERRTPDELGVYLVEAADDAILISDNETSRIVDANKVALEKLGYLLSELTQLSPRDLNQLEGERYEKCSAALLERGEINVLNLPLRCKDGTTLYMHTLVKRYEINGVGYHVNIMRDVDADENSAEILRDVRARFLESEAIYRGLVEFADDSVFVCSVDTGLFIEANPAARRLFGYSMHELHKLTRADLIHPDADPEATAGMSEALARSGRATVTDVMMRRKDGTPFHGYMRLNVYEAANRKLIVGIVRDVTEQLEHDRQLRDASARLATSEATYRGLVACTDDAVLISDVESALFVEANPAACALLGYSGGEWNQLRGRDIHPAQLSASIEQISEKLRARGRAKTTDLPMLRKDGSTFTADLMQNVFEAAGRKLVVSIVRDVTARRRQADMLERSYQEIKRAQAKALHVQKLAAVGEVAAGVAHEINNPAAFVSMNLEAMTKGLQSVEQLLGDLRQHIADEPDDQRKRALNDLFGRHDVDAVGLRAMLDDNREGIDRIRSVTKDLRLFSRVEQSEVIEVDLNAVVRTTLNLLMNELRHRAVITVELEPLPSFQAQRGKLAQVVTNLLLNAAQAIVEGAADQNDIHIRTSHDAGEVVFSVRDTGAGMSEDVAARIFDPFFSTKSREHGMGLGLSLCGEIVANHQGSIVVDSELGRGSRFEVRIPVQTGLVAKVSSPVPPPSSKKVILKRILVIDDDAAMLRAYRRMLVDYDAVVVSSGAQALEVLQKDEPFDVILCDLMMPEMDGPQVYEAIKAMSEDLVENIVFCTGGAFTPRAREFVAGVDNPVLHKPISLAKLERILSGG